jgi:hypothetical protein
VKGKKKERKKKKKREKCSFLAYNRIVASRLNPSQLSPSFNFFTAILFHHKIEEEQP